MNEQAVMHPCHGTQLSNRKEQTIDSRKTGMELKCVFLNERNQNPKANAVCST